MNKQDKPYSIEERTKLLAKCIISYCEELKKAGVDYYLRDQIGRSGTSVGANVHEARSSSSRKEYRRYIEIALRSCNESIYWMGLLKDVAKPIENDELIIELKEISKILATIVIKLKASIKNKKMLKKKFLLTVSETSEMKTKDNS